MAERCPSALKMGVGYIPQQKLVFNRKGSYRPGGVASIAPSTDTNSRVFGIVWRLSAEDLATLDCIEHPSAYYRKTLGVVMPDGEKIGCHTYIAFPEADHVTPDPEYFELLYQAAVSAALPADYLKQILALRP